MLFYFTLSKLTLFYHFKNHKIMKTFQRNVLFTLALLLFFGTNLNAQKTEDTNTTKGTYLIIQKNNGKEKVIHNFDDLDNILLDFNVDKKDAERIERFMHGRSHQDTKPFLGIYSSTNSDGSGIVLDGTVRNSAAQKAGLERGDIITTINGNAINSVADLRGELANHEVGDAINVKYIRNNQPVQAEVILGRKKRNAHHAYSYNSQREVKRDPCKVFIGVYSGTSYSEKGVRVTGVIDNTPAMEVKLLRGDYITAIDGIEVHSHNELLRERNKHNPGDRFLITYTRHGVENDVTAQFKSCPEPTVKEQAPIIEEVIVEAPIAAPAITQPIDNALKVESMEAFPNPTYGDVNLKFKAEALPTVIRVVDIQGRVIYNETLNNFDGNYNRELDLSDGTPGVLSINITQQGKLFTKSIVLLARA